MFVRATRDLVGVVRNVEASVVRATLLGEPRDSSGSTSRARLLLLLAKGSIRSFLALCDALVSRRDASGVGSGFFAAAADCFVGLDRAAFRAELLLALESRELVRVGVTSGCSEPLPVERVGVRVVVAARLLLDLVGVRLTAGDCCPERVSRSLMPGRARPMARDDRKSFKLTPEYLAYSA